MRRSGKSGPHGKLDCEPIEALGIGGPGAALASGLAYPDRGRPSFSPGKVFHPGQIAKTHVTTANVVVPPPGLDQPLRFGQRGEPMNIKTFIPG